MTAMAEAGPSGIAVIIHRLPKFPEDAAGGKYGEAAQRSILMSVLPRAMRISEMPSQLRLTTSSSAFILCRIDHIRPAAQKTNL